MKWLRVCAVFDWSAACRPAKKIKWSLMASSPLSTASSPFPLVSSAACLLPTQLFRGQIWSWSLPSAYLWPSLGSHHYGWGAPSRGACRSIRDCYNSPAQTVRVCYSIVGNNGRDVKTGKRKRTKKKKRKKKKKEWDWIFSFVRGSLVYPARL